VRILDPQFDERVVEVVRSAVGVASGIS